MKFNKDKKYELLLKEYEIVSDEIKDRRHRSDRIIIYGIPLLGAGFAYGLKEKVTELVSVIPIGIIGMILYALFNLTIVLTLGGYRCALGERIDSLFNENILIREDISKNLTHQAFSLRFLYFIYVVLLCISFIISINKINSDPGYGWKILAIYIIFIVLCFIALFFSYLNVKNAFNKSYKLSKKLRNGEPRFDRKKPLLVIHRGGIFSYPGLSPYDAFQKAVGSQADMIEIDVRKTKDNEYIIYHDEKFEGKNINLLSYKELSEIDSNFTEKVFTLKKSLSLAKGKIKLDIELKEEGYEIDIINFLLGVTDYDEFVITSFSDSSLKIIKDAFPKIKTGLLLGRETKNNILIPRFSDIFPEKRIKKCKVDFVAINWKLTRYGFGLIERINKINLPIYIWTVNNSYKLNKLINNEFIDGIITDEIDIALNIRNTS